LSIEKEDNDISEWLKGAMTELNAIKRDLDEYRRYRLNISNPDQARIASALLTRIAKAVILEDRGIFYLHCQPIIADLNSIGIKITDDDIVRSIAVLAQNSGDIVFPSGLLLLPGTGQPVNVPENVNFIDIVRDHLEHFDPTRGDDETSEIILYKFARYGYWLDLMLRNNLSYAQAAWSLIFYLKAQDKLVSIADSVYMQDHRTYGSIDPFRWKPAAFMELIRLAFRFNDEDLTASYKRLYRQREYYTAEEFLLRLLAKYFNKGAKYSVGEKERHLTVLGLANNATWKDIQQRFRALARECHPDVSVYEKAEAERRFKIIYEAYEALYKIFHPPGTLKSRMSQAQKPYGSIGLSEDEEKEQISQIGTRELSKDELGNLAARLSDLPRVQSETDEFKKAFPNFDKELQLIIDILSGDGNIEPFVNIKFYRLNRPLIDKDGLPIFSTAHIENNELHIYITADNVMGLFHELYQHIISKGKSRPHTRAAVAEGAFSDSILSQRAISQLKAMRGDQLIAFISGFDSVKEEITEGFASEEPIKKYTLAHAEAMFAKASIFLSVKSYEEIIRRKDSHTEQDSSRIDTAIESLKKVVQSDKNNSIAWNNLGVILYWKAAYDNKDALIKKAIYCFRKALKINQNMAEAHNNLGIILSTMSDSQDASLQGELLLQADAHLTKASTLYNSSDYIRNDSVLIIIRSEEQIKYEFQQIIRTAL
jgi:tetratricopeptide (TPR) repeat protein